jgi:hypothetical protein
MESVEVDTITQYLFGPLEKSYYCNFFLVFTIFMFVFFIGAIIIFIYGLTKKIGTVFYLNSIMLMIFYFVIYLQARIMYSVCRGSLME